MRLVDCTTSGQIDFQNHGVERKMRKFVVQSRSSEEARISENLPLACKVMHTGDKGKGWGLFAARDITSGEFIGHYAGTVVDVGYSKRYTGHYTFGLIHGLAIDGTRGGALRFMNHAMQDQEPTVHALIVNHFGVCHVAVYARRDIASGEEMTLRYTDATVSACPLLCFDSWNHALGFALRLTSCTYGGPSLPLSSSILPPSVLLFPGRGLLRHSVRLGLRRLLSPRVQAEG